VDLTGRRLAHYQVLERLGAGAMSTVYKARDEKLERMVALKILPPARTPDSAKRFEREARAISALNHPNIAVIYAFEQDDEMRFLALEYVSGGTMADRITRCKKDHQAPTPREVVDACLQIAAGLAHAHRRGVVHRDVKAENVLVSEDGMLKVTDFGVAKVGGDSQLTEEGSLVGTMAYMAPEQILGETVDRRADIFSFGVLAFQIATGELPFDPIHTAQLNYEIVNAPTPKLDEYRGDLPEAFCELIYKTLEKRPGDRLQDLDEAVETLEEIRANLRTGSANATGPMPTYERPRREIEIGETLGRYRVLSKIGEGGMGTVYRAQDITLDRPVALKTLKALTFVDPERKKRFLQEAKAASALNHPNIVTIHEADEQSGVSFIAMEFVEGETLDRRIARGPLGLNESLRIAIQIADALAAAHAAGIVHRDLKPSNVMLADDGRVKLLDFGLAKLGEDVLTTSEAADAPKTEEGAILGTAAYMSPEQAEGRLIDSRSDVFSFGSLLYELETGRRAFDGDSKVSVLAAIVQKQPTPLAELAPETPSELDRIVGRCLRKAPGRRFQHMGDVKVALEDLLEDYEQGRLAPAERPVAAPGPAQEKSWRPVGLALAGGALLGLLAGAFAPGEPPAARGSQEARLTQLTGDQGMAGHPTWSPDGEWVAYASDHGGGFDLWKRPLSGGPEVRLTETPLEETQPAWSPDGRTIAFAASDGGIYVVPSDGGRAVRAAAFGSNPRWTPDGNTIAFDANGSIYLAPYGGGEPREIVTGTSGTPHTEFAPDGKRFYYWDRTRRGVFLGSIDGSQGSALSLTSPGEEIAGLTISPDGGTLVYSKGAFGGDKDLWRTAVDPTTALPTGEPERLTVSATDDIEPRFSRDGRSIAFTVRRLERQLWGVALDPETGLASGESRLLSFHSARNYYPSATPDGEVVVWTSQNAGQGAIYYLRAGDQTEHKLTREWGRDVREVGGTLSPDGSEIAYSSTVGGAYQLWRMPAFDSVAIRLTDVARPQSDAQPSWSPDGERLAFYTNRAGNWDIFAIPARGGEAEPLTDWPSNELYPSWSPDGRWLAFLSDRDGNPDLWRLNLVDATIERIVEHPAVEGPAAWSPDGSRFYFSSNRSGEFAIWMIPSDGGEARRVTAEALHLPETALYTKFAVTTQELIVPLENRRGNVYVLENF